MTYLLLLPGGNGILLPQLLRLKVFTFFFLTLPASTLVCQWCFRSSRWQESLSSENVLGGKKSFSINGYSIFDVIDFSFQRSKAMVAGGFYRAVISGDVFSLPPLPPVPRWIGRTIYRIELHIVVSSWNRIYILRQSFSGFYSTGEASWFELWK